jgi:hypothetical protein
MTRELRGRSGHGLCYVALMGTGGHTIFVDDRDREMFPLWWMKSSKGPMVKRSERGRCFDPIR